MEGAAMTKVIRIDGKPSSKEFNADLVDQLEELLERAKAGEITAMGMALVKADGCVATRWSGGDQLVQMIAAVTLLQADFLSACARHT
jgi:glycerol kinase